MVDLHETVTATPEDVACATAIVSGIRGFGVVLPSNGHQAVQRVARHRLAHSITFRPMADWDKRNDVVLLLVDYSNDGQHALDDALVAITIGHNNDHNVGEGEGQGWQFAGWCWSQEHFTQGEGVPIGWAPLPHHLARDAEAGVVEAHNRSLAEAGHFLPDGVPQA